MNDKDIGREAARLLKEDELVKNIGASLYGNSLVHLALINNALLPHLNDTYSEEDAKDILLVIITSMAGEVPQNLNTIGLDKIVDVVENNLDFLKRLKEE